MCLFPLSFSLARPCLQQLIGCGEWYDCNNQLRDRAADKAPDGNSNSPDGEAAQIWQRTEAPSKVT
jgi:hypothetical protein